MRSNWNSLRRASLFLAATLVGANTSILPGAQSGGDRSALVREELGRVGPVQVGNRVSAYEGFLSQVAPQLWLSQDGAYAVRTNSAGVVSEIVVLAPQMFTQRLLAPKRSTVRDVLSSYGTPVRSEVRGKFIVLDYERFSFLAVAPGELKSAPRDDVLAGLIDAIVLSSTDRIAHLQLKEIRVIEDGELGPSTWAFQVFGGETQKLQIEPKEYDDKKPPVFSFEGRTRARLDLARDLDREIRVLGYQVPLAVSGEWDLLEQEEGRSKKSLVVRAPQLGNGHFRFEFDLVRQTLGALHVSGGATSFQLSLKHITVLEDGSVGDTKWHFEICMNGERVFDLRTEPYDDHLSQPEPLLQRSFTVLPWEPAKISILGYRPANSVQGTLEMPERIRQDGGSIKINVGSEKKPNGNFDFRFDLEPASSGFVSAKSKP